MGQNSNFQLQYKLNETEHHPEILICSLPNTELYTVKKWWSYDFFPHSYLSAKIHKI